MGRDDDHHHSKRRKHSHGEEGERRRTDKLPFDAKQITKDDMEEYRPVFKRYLKERKDIHIDDLSSSEAYARFKSFLHKWNGGDLPSKYYDPGLNHRHGKSHDRVNEDPKSRRLYDEEPKKGNGIYSSLKEEVVGPALPTPEDLQLRKEQLLEDLEDAERFRKATLKSQRKLEKERLEELVPRADAGTRERKLEKRAEIKAVHRSFRDKSPEITVSDDMLMGGDDIKADLLRQKKIEQEREARRDENYRLKEAERLQRQSEMNRREQGTMDMLKKLAQERYGSSGNSGL